VLRNLLADAALSIAEWHMRQAWWWKDLQRKLTGALPWRRSNRGTDNGSGERGRD